MTLKQDKYISFYTKPGQGFLFPQEVFWMDKDLMVKRPNLNIFKNIKDSEQIFVGATLDSSGFKKLKVSDLEIEICDTPYEALYTESLNSK